MPIKNSPMRFLAKKVITPVENKKDKIVVVPQREFVFFFVGGAADKKEYYFQSKTEIVNDARRALIDELVGYGLDPNLLELKNTFHLDYSDAKGISDIEQNFVAKFKENNALVYLIGHSLGAWNVAHLSTILVDMGYQVEYLVTLDPVGKGVLVSVFSDIYWDDPKPKFKGTNWINIRAEVDERKIEMDDKVADFGEQWDVMEGPSINEVLPLHHREAEQMFTQKLSVGKSAMDFLIENLASHLKIKRSNSEKLPEVNLE